jgi:hypothetical protein
MHHPKVSTNQNPRGWLQPSERHASAQHRGECNDEGSYSRSSRFGTFGGYRNCPGGGPQHSYTSALRLWRSTLVGTTAWVRATHLHTTTLRTDSCLPSAARRAWLLHSAVSRCFSAVIRVRTRLLGTMTTRRFPRCTDAPGSIAAPLCQADNRWPISKTARRKWLRQAPDHPSSSPPAPTMAGATRLDSLGVTSY